jgi:hypothetical protein
MRNDPKYILKEEEEAARAMSRSTRGGGAKQKAN